MFYSEEQIRQARLALDEGNRIDFCEKPLVDSSGSTERRAKTYLVADRRGMRQRTVPAHPYGIHGSRFLQVDPATRQIRCGACAGEIDGTIVDTDPPDVETTASKVVLVNRAEE